MNAEKTQIERILVVDDDGLVRDLLQRIMEDEGFVCDTASSGDDALRQLEHSQYSLMISDISMPGMNGLELLEIVRQRWPAMSVVMGSGIDDRDTALDALRRGAVGYLLKPFEIFEVLVNVNNALRLRQLELLNQNRQEYLEAEIVKRTAELVESQRSMFEQEKLASLGQLAAGVAHEVNNPTGYIASNLTTIQKYLSRLEEYLLAQQNLIDEHCNAEVSLDLQGLRKRLKIDLILEDVDDIVADSLEGAERIRRIVLGLKNFSRKDPEEQQLVDINRILEESLTLCWNEVKYKAEIVKDFGDLSQIMGLPQKLSQVFLNLMVNAAHAIEKQGIIRIKTALVNNHIEVLISDSGCGIPEENLKKIFDPFFTTKAVGVGTGLGLAIIQEIVLLHQGEIWVESELGKGSTFGLRLPVAVS